MSFERCNFQRINKTYQRFFIFNQRLKLTIRIFSILSNINIRYYLKFRIPILHRHFFKVLSQNREYVGVFCGNMEM